jgi:hypothetical protein
MAISVRSAFQSLSWREIAKAYFEENNALERAMSCFRKLTGESHVSEVPMLSLAVGTENDSVQLPDDFD